MRNSGLIYFAKTLCLLRDQFAIVSLEQPSPLFIRQRFLLFLRYSGSRFGIDLHHLSVQARQFVVSANLNLRPRCSLSTIEARICGPRATRHSYHCQKSDRKRDKRLCFQF